MTKKDQEIDKNNNDEFIVVIVERFCGTKQNKKQRTSVNHIYKDYHVYRVREYCSKG